MTWWHVRAHIFIFLVWFWSYDNFNVLIESFDFAFDQVHVGRLGKWSYLSSLYRLALWFATIGCHGTNPYIAWSFIVSYHDFEDRSVTCWMAARVFRCFVGYLTSKKITNSHRVRALKWHGSGLHEPRELMTSRLIRFAQKISRVVPKNAGRREFDLPTTGMLHKISAICPNRNLESRWEPLLSLNVKISDQL